MKNVLIILAAFCALEAHFGLGKSTQAAVRVILPGGRQVDVSALLADRCHVVDLAPAK
jgi:hypothetical protein